MTTFTLSGTNTGFLGDAFFNSFDDLDLELVSATSTAVVVENSSTGYITTFTGSGFQFAGEEPTAGTVYEIEIADGNGNVQGTVTGLNWGLVNFVYALDEAEYDNFRPLVSLFESGGPITVDAANAGTGLDMYDLFNYRFADLFTQPLTVIGSGFEDHLFGGRGADTIIVGADNGGYYGDEIDATLGNDTIDFSGVSDSTYLWMDYEDLVDGAVTFNVNSVTNISTIVGAGFTDTLTNVRRILDAEGLGLEGSENNDVFNVTNSYGQWMELIGNEGDDVFNLTLGGTIRLSFTWGANTSPFTGLDINLATGIVNNDGLGGRDTINILGGDGQIEVRGTNHDDTMIGSDRNETFITQYGQDTVDGGGGFDRVRYDRSGVDSVYVNLATESATVIWDNNIFEDTLISIEHVRGSRAGDDEIIGSAADERLEGRGGDDSLVGGGGDDTLEGQDGDDTLEGGAGEDWMYGGAGNDLFVVGAGSTGALITTGLGNDTVDMTATDSWVDVRTYETDNAEVFNINAETNTGRIIGAGTGTTTLLGVTGVVTSADGGLSLFGGFGNDTFNITQVSGGWMGLSGQGGNDTFNLGSSQGGIVRLVYRDFEGYSTGIQANLNTGIIQDGFGGTDTINGAGAVTIELQATMETDTITGSGRDERFILMGGDDTLEAGGGFDLLRYDRSGVEAGVNVDLSRGTATGVWSADGTTDTFTHTISGVEGVRGSNTGNDTLIAGNGFNAYFEGRGGNDSIVGANGHDLIYGGDHYDTIHGGEGNDTVHGDDGRDLIFLNQGNDVFHDNAQGGEHGQDTVFAGFGNDTIQGGNGNDVFHGEDGEDLIFGRLGDDLIYAGAQYDTVHAGEGDDTVHAGDGRDLVFLNQGDDVFHDNAQGGEHGQDTVFAGLGNDTVQGGNGNDIFHGEGGDDLILGRLGNDLIYGGDQYDTVFAGEGSDTVYGGNGRDIVHLNQGDDVFHDNTQGGELGRDTVFAGLGNDTIQGGNGDDIFHGQAGDDLIHGRLGNDLIYGGDQYDTVFAGEGNDTVYGGNGRDIVHLNQGDDVFHDNAQGGELGQDTVYAGFGNDTIQGGNGNDQFFGQDGDDLILARLGDDIVGGGAGNDTLDGGGGNDTLTGGDGVDTFIFNAGDAGTDIVTDFLLGTDLFHLSGTGSATVDYDSGANEVTVTVGSDAVAILRSDSDLSGFGLDDITFI
ncbi:MULTISPECIES: calcium-binding protein [unclassified Sulfitobacter]|uniref:calcium-binding protein n=2 Tax=Sulfitobacter TaxID=60136 RepID=UPI003746CF18